MLSVLGIIVTLVVMEGLLSADNALVLAIMVRKLPDESQRKKALFAGMWGAVLARAFFVFIGTWLVHFWPIQILGALYLGYMVYGHVRQGETEDEDGDGQLDKFQNTVFHKVLRKVGINLSLFWSVIISVEVMDVAFSSDSILAALALSNQFWVLLIGGALGIAMMRGVAGVFLKLIAKVPEFEHTAFILIGLIALRMFLGAAHHLFALFGWQIDPIEVSDVTFFAVLVATFLGTFIVHSIRKPKVA
jgi:YkoY family integral membrane protein